MVVIKIFNANDRDFNTAGNIIIEPLYCHEIKKKSLNGWYIDVEIPIKYKEYIEQDKLCVVKTKSKLKPQAFRIKDIEYTTNKIVFQARHVMFDAEDYFLLDVRPINQNGLNALNYINERTDIVSPFTMYSNVENTNTAYFIRKNLLEAWSTIEEKWNGVFDADNWDISFLVSVGNDKGETIYYRKNLEDMKIIEDWSGVCTKLYPIGKDEMMLPNKYLESETQYDIPYTRTIKFDTQLSDEEQTEENLLNELETNAINYLQENCVPKVCYEINSNISQEMEIGDIIQVKHPLCNISTEVLEYEYDAILEKVIKLVFGNYSKDVKKKFKAVTESIESIKEAVNKQQTTINNQTNLINSLNKNGYVYIDENEILILDTIPKEKAKNVWRFGLGGIGFSSNGYEGPFEVAMTMDGQINANFITTGTLSVSRIEGLANFISETEKQISNIEIQQGNITSRVESVESNIVNLQSQIDGSIQFWNGSDIPTASNYPAKDWSTEEEKNKHRADIYTVIEDIDGELKQGKSYRFDKVGNTWQWIELTDNELSAVQALAQSKAKVFVTTPKVPYSIGDLWLNNGKLYECQVSKDASGSFSSTDWKEAVNYTDDTVANLAKTLANNAQSTADSAVEGVVNITNTTGTAEGKNIYIEDSAEEPLVDISLHGETSQKTSTQSSNLFDEEYYNNDDIYTSATYKYVKARFTGNRVLWFKATLKEGKTAQTGAYIALSESAGSPYVSGTKTAYAISNGSATSGSNTFVDVNTLYINIYPNTLNCATIFDNYNLWVSTDNVSYEKFIPDSPSPDYPSEIKNVEGNVEVKVEGKNLFNNNFNDYTMPKDYRIYPIKLEKGKVYRFNTTLIGTAVTGIVVGIVKNGTMYSEFSSLLIQSISSNGSVNNPSFMIDDTWVSPKLVVYATTQTKFEEIFKNYNVQLVEGTEILDYEPYKSQTAYFPLAEGQKLMEGSYLADDGVHNKRKRIVFDGSDNEGWNKASLNIDSNGNNYSFYIILDKQPKQDEVYTNFALCSMLTQKRRSYVTTLDEEGIYLGKSNTLYVKIRQALIGSGTVGEFKSWLSQNPMQVEYELANPETDGIVPYTEKQQKAWNKIKVLTTYKNITNITSDAYAKVVYMRDNGLDVYETKQNADKRYTETTEKFAEQKITVDGVITQVSDTNKRLTNEYLTAEQVNAELDTTNENIEILSQKQAKTELTSEQFRIDIDKIVNEGVSKVKTSMGYTFDDEGFKLDREGAETGTIIDEAKIKVVDKTGSSETDLLYAGYVKEGNEHYPDYVGQTIVASANMIVQNYLVVPNSRFEKYENPVLGGQGTGVFGV